MDRRVWAAIFGFEVRYHLRQPLLYLVTFVLSVLLFMAGTGGGPGATIGALHLNAPAVILQHLVTGIYLVLFLMTAFVVSAALRDFDRHTAELFFSKPVAHIDYITARFAGAMVVCALPYVVGTAALAAGALMPGLDPGRLSRFSLAPYVFGLGVLVLPTLVALGAGFYALANWTRSTIASYVGIVAFLAANAGATAAMSAPESRWIAQVLDPFGVTALSGALRYWTVAELNTTMPSLAGMLLWNRVLWLVLGLSALGASIVTFDPSRTRRRAGRQSNPDVPPPTAAVVGARMSPVRRDFSPRAILTQFAHRVVQESAAVFASWPFVGALTLGLVLLLQAASAVGSLFGMPVHPRTPLMLEALQGMYAIVLLLVVVLYSGEITWRERALDLDGIHDAMPTPSGVYLGAKLVAMMLVIVAYLLVGVLALIGYQLAKGYHTIEPGLYLRGAAIAAVYPTLMLALACACHVLVRNKLVGYGCVLLFIVAWDLLEELGFEHHLLRYASLPATPYSDFSGYGPFATPFAWFSLYWACAALVLVGLSLVFWKRGADEHWRARLRDARQRMRGGARRLLAFGALGAAATGAWIFYNTNVLNTYAPTTVAAARRADYERSYRQYAQLRLPRVVAVRANVDVFPEERRVRVRGAYVLRNQSTQAQRDIHVSIPEKARLTSLALPPHDIVVRDTVRGYSIYRLHTPLEPGDTVVLDFDVAMGTQGFVNHDVNVSVVGNGTHFTKRDVFPVIGYDAHREIADADARRDQGLAPLARFAVAGDTVARRQSPRAPDADRVRFDVTMSTSADQIAVTSGALMREWTEHGRRYFRYTADAPITHHFAFVSARFAVARRTWRDVTLEVYHDPRHRENVGRMLDAMERSLAYHTTAFGPYPHRELRIVEYPRYERDATSYPGMITMSESMGFNARLDAETAVDFPFHVTAHEVAHQWWGQQLLSANVQGLGVLHETLAQYSALMVSEREVGPARMPGILAYEHDWYLRGRSGERGVEPALARAEREEYVYYHKGALAMYALREAIGEAPLNAALSRFFSAHALQGPPYPTIDGLVSELRAVVPGESVGLFTDWFERTVRFNNAVSMATATPRTDGSYLVHIDVEAHKLQADSTGTEREVPIDDWLTVAVFGDGARGDTLLTQARERVRASASTFALVVKRRPTRVMLDPSYLLIDRDRGDNARRVEIATVRSAASRHARPQLQTVAHVRASTRAVGVR